MAFLKALMINLAINAVWLELEYEQFGKLQFDRECDYVVWLLYLFILWYLFWKAESGD